MQSFGKWTGTTTLFFFQMVSFENESVDITESLFIKFLGLFKGNLAINSIFSWQILQLIAVHFSLNFFMQFLEKTKHDTSYV